MMTATKLWLGVGTLIALMVLSSATIIVRVRSIEGQVGELANVATSRSAAARQLEINILGYSLAVRAHFQSDDPKGRQDAVEEAAAVERHYQEYERLATTDRQREMAARFAPLWQELKTLGQALLDAENRHLELKDSKRFYHLRTGLEKLLDDEMQAEAIETYNVRRDAALHDVRTMVGSALILVLVGSLIAVGTSVVFGRGVVQAQQVLRQAHDELEDRVRQRTAELAMANEALLRSNRELEQFASVASHDLQEPLRKIQAFGDRLQAKCGDQLGDQGHEYLERILASAGRMRTLINDLLTFARVTTKAQPLVRTSLTTVAQEAVSDLENRIQQTGGRVDVAELPTLDADPSQMRQMLQNFISNGLKFHRPDAPPVVTVRGRVLQGGVAGHNGDEPPELLCEITVEDNGIGFEEIYLDRIFEVFQRLHGRNEYEGTGIGLAICRKIVQRHGGQITAKSTPGQGATFLVTLPVQQPSAGNTGHPLCL